MNAKQGHRYQHKGWDVMALETGDGLVKVAPLDDDQPYPLGRAFFAQAGELSPLPMRYFHGELPV